MSVEFAGKGGSIAGDDSRLQKITFGSIAEDPAEGREHELEGSDGQIVIRVEGEELQGVSDNGIGRGAAAISRQQDVKRKDTVQFPTFTGREAKTFIKEEGSPFPISFLRKSMNDLTELYYNMGVPGLLCSRHMLQGLCSTICVDLPHCWHHVHFGKSENLCFAWCLGKGLECKQPAVQRGPNSTLPDPTGRTLLLAACPC